MKARSSDLLRNSNQVGVEFLLAQMQTGQTFLRLADTASHPETRQRSLGHARVVYRTVQRLLPQVLLAPHEKREIERSLDQMECALLQAGCSLEP